MARIPLIGKLPGAFKAMAGMVANGGAPEKDARPAWKDDSLADWRSERDAQHAREREQRAATRGDAPNDTAQGEGDEEVTVTERIGG